jgi:hypothetical protein
MTALKRFMYKTKVPGLLNVSLKGQEHLKKPAEDANKPNLVFTTHPKAHH